VAVDETGSDDVSFGVDLTGSVFPNSTHPANSATGYANVCPEAGHPRPVDHHSVANHEVISHGKPPSTTLICA
jgi:hypothetical protein